MAISPRPSTGTLTLPPKSTASSSAPSSGVWVIGITSFGPSPSAMAASAVPSAGK